jgi:hypothetical protein
MASCPAARWSPRWKARNWWIAAIAVASLVLIATALAASLAPALRATRINCVEALKAEGAPISATRLTLEHLRSIFTRGFDLWGHDRGPLGRYFKVYKRGDFPLAESYADKVLTIPAYIETEEGFLDQYVEAFNKVTSNYGSLLK